jgi:hypothetical protein
MNFDLGNGFYGFASVFTNGNIFKIDEMIKENTHFDSF